MQIILLERIEKLGQMGDVVNVKSGYARNYLLPQKKALRATDDNIAVFEAKRTHLEADNLQRRSDAESIASKMDDAAITVIRSAGDSGQLYGSVASRDIASGLTEAGYTVNRNQVQIERPIKEIGIHDIRIVLHPEVSITAHVNVARSDEEADAQAERAARGEDPVMSQAEQEAAEDMAAPDVEELLEDEQVEAFQARQDEEAAETEAEAAAEFDTEAGSEEQAGSDNVGDEGSNAGDADATEEETKKQDDAG
jgi:large subunit ribosomal protein L9